MSDHDTQLAEAVAALLTAVAATAEPAKAPETVLTIDEVAQRLKVSKSLIYRAIGDGRLKSIRIGKRRLVPVSEVQRLINSAA